MKVPRYLSICKFDFDSLETQYHAVYPFSVQDRFIFLGDIPNMPYHCVVLHQITGQAFIGYHTDNFVEVDE